MTILERRPLQGFDSRYPEIEALGGLFIVPPDAQADEVRKEVLSRGIRAVEVQAPDLGLLDGLPVEYLFVNTALPDIGHVHGLRELRYCPFGDVLGLARHGHGSALAT